MKTLFFIIAFLLSQKRLAQVPNFQKKKGCAVSYDAALPSFGSTLIERRYSNLKHHPQAGRGSRLKQAPPGLPTEVGTATNSRLAPEDFLVFGVWRWVGPNLDCAELGDSLIFPS